MCVFIYLSAFSRVTFQCFRFNYLFICALFFLAFPKNISKLYFKFEYMKCFLRVYMCCMYLSLFPIYISILIYEGLFLKVHICLQCFQCFKKCLNCFLRVYMCLNVAFTMFLFYISCSILSIKGKNNRTPVFRKRS